MEVSSPGRICLFGEHQDYLGLPVIAASISLRVTIEGQPREDMTVTVDLPDINGEETFSMEGDLTYTKEADYFKSGINTLRKDGFTFSNGCDCVVTGNIPVQAGTSSSSAMVVSWINFLSAMSDQAEELEPRVLADLAYRAEVQEFDEAGGMMDHYTSAVGGVVYIAPEPEMVVEKLLCRLGSFVLGDSLEKKDTQAVLSRSKERVIDLVSKIQSENRDFSLHEANFHEVAEIENISEEDLTSLLSTSKFDDPDLCIRTGREQRISNFLLWQLAYTELYFPDLLWPDFNDDEFEKALLEFSTRTRRFGDKSNFSV